jgi:hypothetical protein
MRAKHTKSRETGSPRSMTCNVLVDDTKRTIVIRIRKQDESNHFALKHKLESTPQRVPLGYYEEREPNEPTDELEVARSRLLSAIVQVRV